MTSEKTPSRDISLQFVFTFLNSPYLWTMAREMRDEAKWVENSPAGMSSRALISVILSAAASEAFINELAAEVEKVGSSLTADLAAFGRVMKEVEDSRGSIGLKYLLASQSLSRTMFDKGAQPFQDFDLLRRLRDLLMHVKSPDVFTSRPTSSSKRPSLILTLRQKGLTYPLGEDDQTPWINELQTYKLAAWACETSLNMILAVLAMIPDGPADPSGRLKKAFRNLKKK